MLIRLQFFIQWSLALLLVAGAATAQNKTITLQGSGDAGSSETISLAADANVGVTVNDDGIVVTLPVNVRVKCYGDETEDGYCLLAVSDGTGTGPIQPLSPLIPAFSTPSPRSGGFTLQVSNYDANFSWSIETTAGAVSISSSGLVTVTGLSSGASATVTVTTNRSGYSTGTASATGRATSENNDNLGALTPTFGSPSSQAGGFTVQITNFDSAFTWTKQTTRGTVTISSSGLVTVSGLSAGQSATVTVKTGRSGYDDGEARVTGSATTPDSEPTTGYCEGAPANVDCSRSFNLDDIYGDQEGYEVFISPRTIVSMPMTLKDVGTNNNVSVSLETITDQAVLADPFKFKLWISEKPGGDAAGPGCSGHSTIARGTTNFSQYPSQFACSLPSTGGVFHVNFAITCKFGTTGCTSASDLYRYGSGYKFFLSRY